MTFTPEHDLRLLQQQIQDAYLFIEGVKKCGKDKLVLTFECMSDLLEVDMVRRFGALSTQVRNSDSFCKEMGFGEEKEIRLQT